MNRYKSNKGTSVVWNGGCGFCGLLTIAFIVLRLCGVIDWSWWFVLLPTLIAIALPIVIILVTLIVCAIICLINNIKFNKKLNKKK